MGSEGSPSLKGLQFESPGNNRSPPRQIMMKRCEIGIITLINKNNS